MMKFLPLSLWDLGLLLKRKSKADSWFVRCEFLKTETNLCYPSKVISPAVSSLLWKTWNSKQRKPMNLFAMVIFPSTMHNTFKHAKK
jgi:hypothetical protein